MRPGSKRIGTSHRPEIDKLKGYMRTSTSPFDGCGYPIKKALSELRKEGLDIRYNKEACNYYNVATLSPAWGYNTSKEVPQLSIF